MDIGSNLKEARESRHLSLEDVEEKIKIRRKYLQALENGQYDVLPGQVYAKAFLKSYARFLDLNVEEVMEAFKQSITDETPPDEDSIKISRYQNKSNQDPKPRNWLYLVTIVIVLGLAATVYYSITRGGKTNNPTVENIQSSEPEQVSPSQQSNPPALQQPVVQAPASEKAGVRLKYNVIKNTCWIRVIVDGNPAFQGVVSAGESQEYTGSKNISFTLGNAGVVQVELNGQDLGFLGEEGTVVNREFTSAVND